MHLCSTTPPSERSSDRTSRARRQASDFKSKRGESQFWLRFRRRSISISADRALSDFWRSRLPVPSELIWNRSANSRNAMASSTSSSPRRKSAGSPSCLPNADSQRSLPSGPSRRPPQKQPAKAPLSSRSSKRMSAGPKPRHFVDSTAIQTPRCSAPRSRQPQAGSATSWPTADRSTGYDFIAGTCHRWINLRAKLASVVVPPLRSPLASRQAHEMTQRTVPSPPSILDHLRRSSKPPGTDQGTA